MKVAQTATTARQALVNTGGAAMAPDAPTALGGYGGECAQRTGRKFEVQMLSPAKPSGNEYCLHNEFNTQQDRCGMLREQFLFAGIGKFSENLVPGVSHSWTGEFAMKSYISSSLYLPGQGNSILLKLHIDE